MSNLIEDLLAYAAASSAPLNPVQIDLDQLVASLSAELRASSSKAPMFSTKSLGVVEADPVMVRQLFANLLGNAVKYTPDGIRPRVRLSAVAVGAQLEVSITDNGIGIPEDMRASVFEGFVRVPSVGTAYAGTGLGLAICLRAVERHGGTIRAQAGPGGVGTSMVFRLPLATSSRHSFPASVAGPPSR